MNDVYPNGSPRPRRNAGFTLMELMIVISIISLLVALTVGGIIGYGYRLAREAAAGGTIQQFALALNQYYNDCGRYPPTPDDRTQNASVYAVLTGDLDNDGEYSPEKGKDIPTTHRSWRRPYMRIDRKRSDAMGNLLDPWGKPYRYFENEHEAPKCLVNKKSFLLYSLGPDRQATDATREDVIDFSKPFNKDNIQNWENE